jgi:hypothetical protein
VRAPNQRPVKFVDVPLGQATYGSGTALVLTDVVLGFLRRLIYLRKYADVPVSRSYPTCSLQSAGQAWIHTAADSLHVEASST